MEQWTIGAQGLLKTLQKKRSYVTTPNRLPKAISGLPQLALQIAHHEQEDDSHDPGNYYDSCLYIAHERALQTYSFAGGELLSGT